MKENGNVETAINNGIAAVTFSHPRGNSLPAELLARLAAAITRAGDNPEVSVIILKSTGEGPFCAGASFEELIAIDSFEKGRAFFMGFANVINAMRKCPKFIIARIHGKAVGGGVGLAAAADYALALGTASVKLSEFALGIGPFVVGPAVERKTGKSAFACMATDADWHDAPWAREKGLYNNVYTTMIELDNAVVALAGKLAIYSPDAARELKRILWEDASDWDALLEQRAEISGRLVLSDYTEKAISAFRNKQK
ncbi:MAG TPA: enoyl-CoA hydratase-related protein [Ignavibacteriales bacterium]|nr:enoyl-CoA hydratase-related protein [Ignavibacteriales bacterium]